MPFSEGGDLSGLYTKTKQAYRGGKSLKNPDPESYFHERQILWWAKQMIQGVGALHDAELVHKDIKTPNILINKDMKLVVCDFGLVQKVPKGETITRGGGTPSTWAPEVASKKAFNCSADWWSIGIVIYQLMFQRSPFDNASLTKGAGEDKAAFTKKSRDQYQARLKDEGFVIKYDESEGEEIPAGGIGLADKYTAELKALVGALLVRDPTKRLGYTHDAKEILEHPAFKLLTAVDGQDGSP